jgi:hypothetical protein
MQLVPQPLTLSIIIDAAYVHKVGDTILEIARRNPPPETLGGSYFLRGVVRQSAFWLPIIANLPRLAKLAGSPADTPVRIRTFVFDALFSPGATGLAATAGEYRLIQPDELSRAAAERAFVYWFGPTPLFRDPQSQAGRSPAPAITAGTINTPDGDVKYAFSVPLREGLVHCGAAKYDLPGLYLGYLSATGAHEVNQKEVDTMMALCMLLEAQQGHTVVFYGQDTDLVPAVQLASQYGRAFVCSLTHMPQRWRAMQAFAPEIATEELPVLIPAFKSWTTAEREQACMDVADALNVSPGRVKSIDFNAPTVVDSDFLQLLHAYEPQRVSLELRQVPRPSEG